MGFFSDDMVPMLGVFEAETSELADAIAEIASRVDGAGQFSPEDTAELFRCAHTIKGSSAMMGLETMSQLTHDLEDLFDILRQDPSSAEGHTTELTDFLYSFTDYVTDEVGRMEKADYEPRDASALISAITSYAAKIKGLATDSADTSPAPQQEAQEPASEPMSAAAPEDDSTVIKVSFKPDVPMVNARAMVIVRQLAKQVDIRSHIPWDLMDDDAAKKIASEGLLLSVDPKGVEAAVELMSKNSFVRHIDVLAQETTPNRAADAKEGASEASLATTEKFVTLRWSSIHALQDLAGELISHLSFLKSLTNDISNEALRSAVSDTGRMVDELAYHIDKMAMVPMSAMVPQLSRMVRDMCRKIDKHVTFDVQGGGIDIDRNLYNSIADPLMHIIRNSVDHGIESPEERRASGKDPTGKVTLSIQNLGARVAFRVSDDGRGIDTGTVLERAQKKGLLTKAKDSYTHDEVLRMIMVPGLSTTDTVTQYSGRGVGMDVVSAVVRDFNGTVDIESQPGEGTTMTLFMPVSVTVIECLGFQIGPATYFMPLYNVSKIYTADEVEDKLSVFEDSTLFEYNKHQVPVLDMHRLLACEGTCRFYVVCHSIDEEFVIGVDNVLGQYSCSGKPLPSTLDERWQALLPIRNVTIMDSGLVGLVLYAPLLADFAQGRKRLPDNEEHEMPVAEQAPLTPANTPEMPLGAFVFGLGDESFAISIERVVRICPMPACSPVPHPLPYLMGLMNDRNHIVCVFDLAASAGATEPSPYVLIVDMGEGNNIGLAITSATGVVDLTDARPLDEQGEPRTFAANLRTTTTVKTGPKTEPITILV